MRATQSETDACFSDSTPRSRAVTATLTVAGSGEVTSVTLGPLADAATRACLARALRACRFPPFRRAPLTLAWTLYRR